MPSPRLNASYNNSHIKSSYSKKNQTYNIFCIWNIIVWSHFLSIIAFGSHMVWFLVHGLVFICTIDWCNSFGFLRFEKLLQMYGPTSWIYSCWTSMYLNNKYSISSQRYFESNNGKFAINLLVARCVTEASGLQ